MSWMDSWSRPSKHSAIPPPLYLTVGDDVPYCHTCGRVMSARMPKPSNNNSNSDNNHNNKKNKKSTPVKYCSDRCRSRKPGPVDRKIERAIVSLLNGDSDSGLDKTKAKDRVVKGDHRIVVTMDEIEEIVFGSRFDPNKVFGRRKNRASRALDRGKDKEWKSVDMESDQYDSEDHHGHDDGGVDGGAARNTDGDEDEGDDEEDGGSKIVDPLLDHQHHSPRSKLAKSSAESLAEMVSLKPGPRIRPPQTESEINFSVGGERGKAEKIEESPADLEKRNEGQKKAEEREMVRRAARRGIVFGFTVEDQKNNTPAWEVTTKSSKRRSKNNTNDQELNVTPPEQESTQQTIRKCEALINGTVVEPSFAKGNWAVRWRE